MLSKCNQSGCTRESVYLFIWPGRDMAGICAEHSGKLRAVAEATGLHLQLLPVLAMSDPVEKEPPDA